MSENLNRGLRDFSRYDTMETEELEQILRLDAEAPEGAESDTELLLYVMEVLADRRNKSNITGKTALQAWESFQQNYLPEESEYAPKKEVRRSSPWLRRLIAAAAVLALVVCVPVTAKAFGWEDLWDIFARWAKETFSFVSGENTQVSEPSPDDQDSYGSLREVLQENNIDTDFIPTWMPDGFVLDVIKMDVTPVQETYIAYYTNEDKVLRIRVQNYLSSEFQKIETSEDYSETYPVSGIDYYLFENLDQVQAIWICDSYECTISGDLSIDEIKSMIDSIGKG